MAPQAQQVKYIQTLDLKINISIKIFPSIDKIRKSDKIDDQYARLHANYGLVATSVWSKICETFQSFIQHLGLASLCMF